MIKSKEFENYESYVTAQKRRAVRGKKCTKSKYNDFVKVAKSLKKQFPQYQNVLCIGSRHPSEIKAFNEEGFTAVGIDLIKSDGMIECDMSKIPEHDFFKDKKMDILFCSHSLEHCLDFEGFIKGVEYLGTKVIMVLCPLRESYSEWDCTIYDFMKPSGEITKEDILKYFTGFELLDMDVKKHRRKNRGSITFTLKRSIA